MVRISLFLYLLFSSLSVIVFFLPLYFQSKGLDSGQIGTIIGVGVFVGIFGQLFWGYVSDRKKTVKYILLTLIISSFLLSIGLFSANTFVFILLFYVAFMLFNSSVVPMSDTLCISYANKMNKDYGRLRLWGEIGIGTGALFLGIVVGKIGIHNLWFIYAAILALVIIAIFLLKDTRETSTPINLTALRKMVSDPRFLWFLFTVLLISIPHRMNDSMLAIFLIELEASESQVGLAWLLATLSTIPVLLFIGGLIKKWNWNPLVILVIAAVVYSIRWFIYSQAVAPYVLIFSQLLHSSSFALLLVASIQYLVSIVPPELRATGQAAYAVTFSGLAGIIGNTVGGSIIDQYGPHTAYGAGSVLSLLGGVVACLLFLSEVRKNRHKLLHAVGEQEYLN